MSPQAHGPVGMAEIAAIAGVAVSTVSRALSGESGVSSARRARILDIARSTGYLADGEEKTGRRHAQRHVRVAAIIPESDRWVFGSILAGMHDILTPAGASLTVHQGLSSSERIKRLTSATLEGRSQVVVLVPMPRAVPVSVLRDSALPVVVAGSAVEGIPSVGIDDVVVGQKSTNYLINTGRRRICYASYTDHDGTPGNASLRREQGFTRSMERAGLDPGWQIRVPFGPTCGREAAEQLLEGDVLPDGLVVCSDEMAAGMMTVLRRAGVRIPEDLAIIGVDDHPIAELIGLSTIAQPAREQGRVAASLALHSACGTLAPEPVVLPTHLVVRESTSRLTPQ